MSDCGECLTHESGTCFKHKMEYMRSKGGLQIVKAAPSLNDEIRMEHEMAAQQGRRLRVKE